SSNAHLSRERNLEESGRQEQTARVGPWHFIRGWVYTSISIGYTYPAATRRVRRLGEPGWSPYYDSRKHLQRVIHPGPEHPGARTGSRRVHALRISRREASHARGNRARTRWTDAGTHPPAARSGVDRAPLHGDAPDREGRANG